ncbi:serine-rich adhesin for platelets-like isoform X2 [Mytilus californianus]|uniref:serine-rich adhesin for platelets-like isoform X2 n=1 Tax=Mytilus californianus TaxID=6549 RepID=UPI0022462914|nr:serine-rich adhesin for platelets-like isoform X2 [Mytilus californianus]
MAILDVPLLFCGYTFCTVVLLLSQTTAENNSTITAESNSTTTISPTTVNNSSNLLTTDIEATELFPSNYPSSSVLSNNSDEVVSPSSSSMFIDTTLDSSIDISLTSSIDMLSYISSSSPVNIMASSNNPTQTMSSSDNPFVSSTPNMLSSSDIVTLTSTSVNNTNQNNQNSSSQTTAGSQPEMSITQTTDVVETNSPMISTGLNSMTNMYSSPSSMESSTIIDIVSSVSDYLKSSKSEGTSSISKTENPSLTTVGNGMTSIPIIDASSSVSINSLKSEMESSSVTIVSVIQSATHSNIVSIPSLDIIPSSTITQTTSSSNILVSSSVLPTTSTTTTTTTTTSTNAPPSTTLADDIQSSIDGNSLFEVSTELDIVCDNIKSDEDLRKFIEDEVLQNVDAVRKVVVVENGCKNKTRRKRAASHLSDVKISVDANTAAINSSLIVNQIIEAFENNTASNLTNAKDFKVSALSAFSNPCNAGVCDKFYGYLCTNTSPTEATCTSRCKDVTCSNHGTCSTIVTDNNMFGHHCSCASEEYYKYEGDNCEVRRMKWELAVAIAAGSGGAVILILIFVLIICCCCKNKGDKYGYDRRHSYEPMSDVMGRPGPPYYRNDSKNQQPGFTNLGYDDDKYSDYSDPSQTRPPNGQSWNPEDSKDTYAKITEQLDQEKRFEIRRPQVSGSIRQNSAESYPTGRATTGF